MFIKFFSKDKKWRQNFEKIEENTYTNHVTNRNTTNRCKCEDPSPHRNPVGERKTSVSAARAHQVVVLVRRPINNNKIDLVLELLFYFSHSRGHGLAVLTPWATYSFRSWSGIYWRSSRSTVLPLKRSYPLSSLSALLIKRTPTPPPPNQSRSATWHSLN